ncbi:hypothetical protein ACW0JT_13660 [Arthrobacter sp. SA17]
MSQEQPPVRSRRELRQARDARLDETRDAGAQAPGQVPPVSKQPTVPQPEESQDTNSQATDPLDTGSTGRVRRVAPEPVDSVRTSAERSSQIRARDRAALRTIKELAEKEEQLSAGGPPTRRQLRLQQLRAEASPPTAANPVVSAPWGSTNMPADGHKSRRQESAAGSPAERQDAGLDGLNVPDGMTVEQALVTRTLIAEQAKNQLAKMEHIAANDPEAVDPEVLAQQIALAERAAVLNKRAMAKQKLAEQATAPQQPRHDPTAASNLAMVTPLEFVQVPGIDRPVMKKPATSYVPVVTHPGHRVPAERQAGPRKPGAPRLNSSGPITGRSGVLARAEAVAQAASSPAAPAAPAAPQTTPVSVQRRQTQTWDAEAEENFTEHPRVSANAAYGLEPLDAVTAGLGRAHRLRLLQLAVLAIGIVALIAGVTMIISGLTR